MEATATRTDLHSFTVATWADSRSNRRDRTYTVEAAHANDARDEAVARAEHDIRHHRSIYATIVDVDGQGAPQDCPHDHERLWDGFTVRWDGGHLCHTCTAKEAAR